MIINLIEHRNGTLRDVEYLRVGPRRDGLICLQVKIPGAPQKTEIAIRHIKRIVARGQTLVPSSRPYSESSGEEIRAFLEH
jgi:hypothetical protein